MAELRGYTTIGGYLALHTANLEDHMYLSDSKKIYLGSDDDAYIHHDGTDMYVVNTTGDMYLDPVAGEHGIRIIANDYVALYHNNVPKLVTNVGGVIVTGNLATDGVSVGDNEYIDFGAGTDLRLYSDGTNGILSAPTSLYMMNSSETMFKAVANAQVELWYDNSKKLETTSTGIKVTQDITADGVSPLITLNGTDADNAGQIHFTTTAVSQGVKIRHELTDGDLLEAGTALIIEGIDATTAHLEVQDNIWAAGSRCLTTADVDDTPVDAATTVPVSSNWAYDHVNATNPHNIPSETSHSDVLVDGDFTAEGVMYRNASSGSYTTRNNPTNGNWWNSGYINIAGDGVMEMGKYMDFHTSDDAGATDYDFRVTVSDTTFTASGIIAATGGNSTEWNLGYDHSGEAHAPSNADNTAANETSHATVTTSAAVLTDNALVRGNGGSRDTQTSSVLLDDSDNMSGVNDMNIDGDYEFDTYAAMHYNSTTKSIDFIFN